MFVRSLRVAGFKSFADPTILEFEPGVNVIVGPNGSGKSNIADALGWVLGSQAPSTMRGASMEDVIFAGSSGRPRLGSAEVDLVLDNSSGVLPLDVAEVTISRYADRAGVSEYRINGAACRLLDVAELLSDTGIGRSLHSLVGQGQLEAVLGARPEDRRAFVEEAAQVGKYRRRKDRALRKLERVDDNLTRLADVLAEVRRAVRPLQRQAGAARAHSELLGEARELRQRLAGAELRSLEAATGDLDTAGRTHRAELLGEELAHVQALLGAAATEREATREAAEEAGALLVAMGRVTDRLGSLGRVAEERAQALAARLAAETEEGYRERIRLLDAERARFGESTRTLEEASEEAARSARGLGATADRVRARVGEAEAALARARADETEATQRLVRAEGLEAAGRASLDSVEARIKAIVERREVAGHELEDDAAAVAAAEGEVRSLEDRLDAATEAAARSEAAFEGDRESAESLRDRLAVSRASEAAARARLETLREVLEVLAGMPDARALVEPLLARAATDESVAASREANAADMARRAEAAVEERWQEVARRDEELSRLDALAAGAGERLAGARRRRETREIELAALDEELARAQEALAVARRAATEERAALPARRAELDERRGAREEAERALAAARSELEQDDRAANAALVEARAAHERALGARLRLEEAEAGIADARTALEGIAGRREVIEAARRRAVGVARVARSSASRARGWSEEAGRRAAAAGARARAAEERLAHLRRRERELEDRLQDVRRSLNEAEVRRAELGARADMLAQRAMDEWGLAREALAALPPLSSDEEGPARRRLEHLEREMRRMGPVNPRAAEEYEEASARESFLDEQMNDLRSSRRDLLKVVREVDDTIVEVFGAAFEAVSKEFESVFARIFPGGRGRLTLTDEQDLLAGGIDIEARPPGKSVKKLSLLSGGERSLVALAFLFSIFRSLPSPFYLLDEVEAALDDINLQRFIELVAELQTRAQVMIVTHQKRTMEAADVLYGVTMTKDGVSRVVAQRMHEVAV